MAKDMNEFRHCLFDKVKAPGWFNPDAIDEYPKSREEYELKKEELKKTEEEERLIKFAETIAWKILRNVDCDNNHDSNDTKFRHIDIENEIHVIPKSILMPQWIKYPRHGTHFILSGNIFLCRTEGEYKNVFFLIAAFHELAHRYGYRSIDLGGSQTETKKGTIPILLKCISRLYKMTPEEILINKLNYSKKPYTSGVENYDPRLHSIRSGKRGLFHELNEGIIGILTKRLFFDHATTKPNLLSRKEMSYALAKQPWNKDKACLFVENLIVDILISYKNKTSLLNQKYGDLRASEIEDMLIQAFTKNDFQRIAKLINEIVGTSINNEQWKQILNTGKVPKVDL